MGLARLQRPQTWKWQQSRHYCVFYPTDIASYHSTTRLCLSLCYISCVWILKWLADIMISSKRPPQEPKVLRGCSLFEIIIIKTKVLLFSYKHFQENELFTKGLSSLKSQMSDFTLCLSYARGCTVPILSPRYNYKYHYHCIRMFNNNIKLITLNNGTYCLLKSMTIDINPLSAIICLLLQC